LPTGIGYPAFPGAGGEQWPAHALQWLWGGEPGVADSLRGGYEAG